MIRRDQAHRHSTLFGEPCETCAAERRAARNDELLRLSGTAALYVTAAAAVIAAMWLLLALLFVMAPVQ